MEITGKIIEILPLKQGRSAKGEWQKQDFILETQDQFPKKVCISVWNNKFDVTSMQGSQVKAFIDVESREYNGKWYTDVKAWKIEQLDAAETGNQPPLPTEEDDISGLSFSNDEQGDDLPF